MSSYDAVTRSRKAVPQKPRKAFFWGGGGGEMEWVVSISWQLWDIRGSYRSIWAFTLSYETNLRNVSYDIIQLYNENLSFECRIAKRWLNFNHRFKRELFCMRSVFPNVNVNSIQHSYKWTGLSKATCHSFRSREQSAQCPLLILLAQI